MTFRAILLAAFLVAGCGTSSTDGTVTGTITLDGQPVDAGLIRFIPVDGLTQPDDAPIAGGAYTITMPPGEKRVEIFWMKTDGKPEDTATQGRSKSVQMIPEKYNTRSTLTYTIVPGPQTKDFPLLSK